MLVQRLLYLHAQWLSRRPLLTVPHGQWLYGLLARLEKPLHNDTAALVRDIYRRCCALRAALEPEKVSFPTSLAAVNVLISITGCYFGQGEEYARLGMGGGKEGGREAGIVRVSEGTCINVIGDNVGVDRQGHLDSYIREEGQLQHQQGGDEDAIEYEEDEEGEWEGDEEGGEEEGEDEGGKEERKKRRVMICMIKIWIANGLVFV